MTVHEKAELIIKDIKLEEGVNPKCSIISKSLSPSTVSKYNTETKMFIYHLAKLISIFYS